MGHLGRWEGDLKCREVQGPAIPAACKVQGPVRVREQTWSSIFGGLSASGWMKGRRTCVVSARAMNAASGANAGALLIAAEYSCVPPGVSFSSASRNTEGPVFRIYGRRTTIAVMSSR